MKLLFISQYFPPETGAGATRASTLRRYLTELGWQVDVLCEMPNYPSGKIPKEYRARFIHKSTDEGGSIVRTWVIPTRRENFIQQLLMFASFMISSLFYGIFRPKKYDAIYATSPPIFGAITGMILSRIYRVPFFFEVRDLWPDAALETGHIRKFNISYKISKRIEKRLYRKARLVIPVTRHSEKIIQETCPQARTYVVYNGVDTLHFKPVEDPLSRIPEPMDEKKFKVGYVGTIGVIHDLDTVIKAAKILEDDPDIVFYLIGEGSRSAHLKRLLEEHQPKNVHWLGIKPHSEIPLYLSALDLGLNPVYQTRVFESIITVKFFEYLSCKIPVITMARGLLKKVGDASKAAITIPPENPEMLADSIRTLKDDPEKRKIMAANGRPFVERYFDRKKWATVLSDVLMDQLDMPGDRPSNKKEDIQILKQNVPDW